MSQEKKINNNIQDTINNYWDKRSADFAKVRRRELKSGDAALWREYILRRVPNIKGAKILDVGTGAGFFAVLLAKEGGMVTGIDMSEGMLKEAAANADEFGVAAKFLRMNAQELDFPDETFDVVISRNLTWTLPDAMQAYREWHRVLKIGGLLLNFDSDCVKISFEKKDDADDVHAGVTSELIDECNAIKNELRISTHTRPEWDTQLLTQLNFFVTCKNDISERVYQDAALKHDELPLFAVCAVKMPLLED